MTRISDDFIGTETAQAYLRRHDIGDAVKKFESEDPEFSRKRKAIYNHLEGLSPLDQKYWDVDGSDIHIVFDTLEDVASVLAWHEKGDFFGGQYMFATEMSCDGKVLRLNTYDQGKIFDQRVSFKDLKGQWHLRSPNEREKAENYLRSSPMLKEAASLVKFNPFAWFRMKRIQRALEGLSRDGEDRWRTNVMFDMAFKDAKEAAAELIWRAYGRGFLKVVHQILVDENRVRVVTHYKGTNFLDASLYAFKDKGRYRVCLVGGCGFE